MRVSGRNGCRAPARAVRHAREPGDGRRGRGRSLSGDQRAGAAQRGPQAAVATRPRAGCASCGGEGGDEGRSRAPGRTGVGNEARRGMVVRSPGEAGRCEVGGDQ